MPTVSVWLTWLVGRLGRAFLIAALVPATSASGTIRETNKPTVEMAAPAYMSLIACSTGCGAGPRSGSTWLPRLPLGSGWGWCMATSAGGDDVLSSLVAGRGAGYSARLVRRYYKSADGRCL